MNTRLVRTSRPTITVSTQPSHSAAALLIGLFAAPDAGEDGDTSPELPDTSLLSEDETRQVYDALIAVGASGAPGEITRIAAPAGAVAPVVIALGLGTAADLDDESLRSVAGDAARALHSTTCLATTVTDFGLAAFLEGWLLGAYSYPGFHQETPATTEQEVVVVTADPAATETVADVTALAEGVYLTRDLVNTPANLLYPEAYAHVIAEEAADLDVEVTVLDDKDLAKAGFGGILAVGQGSTRPPRLVQVTWRGGAAEGVDVALVGKGITFDTGGISLKPAAKMENMISDMAGSAAVVGAVFTAARLHLPVTVRATVALAENMPSGAATRPGDVITHYGGITSEVINTDAEGRLVLADAIVKAVEDSPTRLIDTATLTGAQLVALGARTAGVMGTDAWRDTVATAGRAVGENAWAMPLLAEHDKDITSPIADLRNASASRNGGMLFAARYLQAFVPDDVEWAHIDVAGPAFNESAAYGYVPARATGAPLRTIIEVLRHL